MEYRRYYPVFLDVQDRPCLVVGGGAIGLEKAKGLVEAGARVTLVTPEAVPELAEMAEQGRLVWERRSFEPADLAGKFLVFGATDDNDVNREVARIADRDGKLANAVDDPPYCNFILAALVTDGPMTVAVSSAGCSPALAQRVRDRVRTEIFEPGIGELAALLGASRPQAKACIAGYRERKLYWEAVLAGPTPQMVRDGEMDAARLEIGAELERHCDNRCALKGLTCQRRSDA